MRKKQSDLFIPPEERAWIKVSTKDILERSNRWGVKNNKIIESPIYFHCSTHNKWGYEGQCLISCGHWHRLKLTLEEKEQPYINLIDFFTDLFSYDAHQKIGLVTFQNGINNNYDEDFLDMGESIIGHLAPESPLVIGIYNQSKTLVPDYFRMQGEFCGCRTEVVRSNRKLFSVLSKRLVNHTHHPDWLHMAHSEGGLIAHDTLTGLSLETSAYCLNHLIIHTYGSVKPIAERAAKSVINFYSPYDIAYNHYGFLYEDLSGYKIKLPETPPAKKPLFPIPGDHAFMGETYQEMLKINIEALKDIPGFYDGKG